MREQVASPLDSFVLKLGIGWYAGVQQADNDIVKPPPPAPYLCTVATDVARRAWCAARIGILHTPASAITVVYYVDPEAQHLYAQPHPNTAEANMRDWGISEPRTTLPFELARETARWIYKVSRSRVDPKSRRPEDDLAEWWSGYMTSPKPVEPPIPLGMPRHPSHVYRDQGWIDAKDWLKKPGKASMVDESGEDDVIGEAAV